MFKGTQGKWYIEGEPCESGNEYHGSFDIITNEREQVVSQVAAYSFFGQTLETSKYNALLISKAPEMLEVLQWLLELRDTGMEIGQWDKVHQLIKEATEL